MHNAWPGKQDAARPPVPDRDQAVWAAGARKALRQGAGTGAAGVDGRTEGARNMCARVWHSMARHGMGQHGMGQHSMAWDIPGLILRRDAQKWSQ